MLLFPWKLIAGAVLAATSLAAMAEAPQAVPPVPGASSVPAAPGAAPAVDAASAEDDTFLLLREAARQNDAARANALASRLPDYVLPGYVDYYRLKPRLREATAVSYTHLRAHET